MSAVFDHLFWTPVLAVVAWACFSFFGSPVLSFYKIRRDVRYQTLLHWGAPEAHTIEPSERAQYYESLSNARAAFKELGAQLVAFDQSEWMASWFVRKMGFEAAKAGIVLKTIALEFGTTNEDRQKNFRRLDTALKFKFDENWYFYDPYNPGPHKKKT
jgi:hypothetical protein